MKRTAFTKVAGSLLIIAILASGCVSTTVLHTTPANADVYVKGQRLGETPYSYSDRKIAGASTLITLRKEGYEDYNTTIRKNKRLNIGALISGLFFIYPLFWIMGYEEAHSYDLEKVEVTTQPVAVIEPAQTEIAAQAVPADNLPDTIDLPQSARVEKLLAQGQIEKAVEYAEEQEGAFQYGCYYSIAQYYLNKGDYANAEDFFNRSEKTNVGYVRIAESLMRGEIVDSVVVIDENKIKAYLEKAYDNEEEVLGKMAVCYEKYADESKERIALAKSLKGMGMIAMSSGDKTINIDRTLTISQAVAIFYLNSALNVYEKLENLEKTEELRNEIEAQYNEFPGKVSTKHYSSTDSAIKIPPAESETKKLPQEGTAMNPTREDDRIRVSVDSVVRSDTQPQSLVIALKEAEAYINSRYLPGQNNNYVLVYITITNKKEHNIGLSRAAMPQIYLKDEFGNQYNVLLERGTSYIKFPGGGYTMWNPAGPQKDGIIIDDGYLLFNMPKNLRPVQMKYSYLYKEDAKSKKNNTGQLIISLLE